MGSPEEVISRDRRDKTQELMSDTSRELDPSFQVAGNHYAKHKIQPWDIIDEYRLSFYEGNVLKYLLRYKDKNGVEDLKKAKHYLSKLIQDYEDAIHSTES